MLKILYDQNELKLLRNVNKPENSDLLAHYKIQKHVISQIKTLNDDKVIVPLKEIKTFDTQKATDQLCQNKNILELSDSEKFLIRTAGDVECSWRQNQGSDVLFEKFKNNSLFLLDLKNRSSVYDMSRIVQSESRTLDCLKLKPVDWLQRTTDGSSLTHLELKSIQKFIFCMREVDMMYVKRLQQAFQLNTPEDTFFVFSPVLATFIGTRMFFECYTMYKLTNNLKILIDASLDHLRLDKSFLNGLNAVHKSTASLAATAQSFKNSLSLNNINSGADSLHEWVAHRVVGPFC